VTLIGVTKGVAVDRIREAVALGLTDLGENRIQEGREKQQALGSVAVRWHLIGHLQRNKARHAVELFDLIHSVDSLELIGELDRCAAQRGRKPDVLIQVNVSGEDTKHGCRPQDAAALAEAVDKATHVKLVGLMTIPPFSNDPEASRPFFRQLRELRDRLRSTLTTHHSPLKLSMGMSQDFEVAIEEGADLVRIGTAIFYEDDS